MIYITKFDSDFNGRMFKDRTLGTQSVLTCVGYGDNDSNGNPYFVGMYMDTTVQKTVRFKTVLMRDVEFS